MAANATFAHRFVFEDKRSALRSMALQAGVVVTEKSRAPTLHALHQIRAAALDRVALVRVMAIGATDLAFEHRMMVRQQKRRAHLSVTLETGFGGFARIDDENVAATAGFHVQTARAVAGFAAHVFCVGAFGLEAGMRCRAEIARDCFVAGRAFFGADEFGAGNARRRHDRVRRLEVAA